MQILLTNDDGIQAAGLHAVRQELQKIAGVKLGVIAPDSNRSASARSITTRRPLWVEEVDLGDGSVGYATDGTPVDCVRLAQLGLIDGFTPELVVSGINHGVNLGDDITYSGTVAAALEGLVLGLPAVAVSQQSQNGGFDYRNDGEFKFDAAAKFVAKLVAQIDKVPLPKGTLLNINAPAEVTDGAQVTHLGKRVYRDRLTLKEEDGRRRLFHLYGDDPTHHDEDGTDLNAVTEGKIAVTPLHFDLTDHDGIQRLKSYDLNSLL